MNYPRALILAIAMTLVAGVSALYYLRGREHVYRFTETQLELKLAQYFPIEKTYLLIVQATLYNPRLSLPDGSSRIGSTAAAGVHRSEPRL